jgi:hypothetical protein
MVETYTDDNGDERCENCRDLTGECGCYCSTCGDHVIECGCDDGPACPALWRPDDE